MYRTLGNTIYIARGDSAELSVQVINAETEAAYMLSTDEKLQFDLYSMRSASPIISRSAGRESQESDGTVKLLITPQDTTMLYGTYKYAVRVVNETDGTADAIIGLENDAYFNIR